MNIFLLNEVLKKKLKKIVEKPSKQRKITQEEQNNLSPQLTDLANGCSNTLRNWQFGLNASLIGAYAYHANHTYNIWIMIFLFISLSCCPAAVFIGHQAHIFFRDYAAVNDNPVDWIIFLYTCESTYFC